MVKKKRESNSVVKIDSDLLKRVEDFISREENKFKFVNKKQLVDLAVMNFLNGGVETNEK